MNKEIYSGYPDHSFDDDEIDLIELFQTIASGWKIWITTTIIAIASAFAYNHYATPQYEASMSFFVPASSSESSTLRSYAALLGTGTPANIEDQLLAIAESQRIRLSVTQTVAHRYPKPFETFEQQYALKQKKKLLPELRIKEYSQSVLKLEKTFSATKSKTGLFELKYEYSDPKIAKFVIQTYLDNLTNIYQELELTSELEIIKVLDAPQVTDLPVKPKKSLNLALSIVAGGGIGILIVLIRKGFSGKSPSKKDSDTI